MIGRYSNLALIRMPPARVQWEAVATTWQLLMSGQK